MSVSRIGPAITWPTNEELQMEAKLTEIVNLLNAPTLFIDNDTRLEQARKKLHEFERSYQGKTNFYLNRLNTVKAELAICTDLKARIPDIINGIKEEDIKRSKAPGLGALPSFYHVDEIIYTGTYIKVSMTVTDWAAAGPDRYEESSSSTRPLVRDILKEKTTADNRDDLEKQQKENETRIEEILDQVNDLLNDHKLDFEAANEKIRDIEKNHFAKLAFKHAFQLSMLKDKSLKMEAEMRSAIQALETKFDQRFEKNDKKLDSAIEKIDKNTDTLNTIKTLNEEAKTKLQGIILKGNQIGQQLAEAMKEQAQHTQLLKSLDKKASDLQAASTMINKQLHDVKQAQDKHTQALESLNKKSSELQQSFESANNKLNDIKSKQETHNKLLNDANKKSDELIKNITSATSKLNDIHYEQEQHKQALSLLDKKTSEIKQQGDKTHSKIAEIKKEQEKHQQALHALDNKASDIVKQVDNANTHLKEVRKEQSSHTHELTTLNHKASEITNQASETLKQLNIIKHHQQDHSQELSKLNKKADELQYSAEDNKKQLHEIGARQKLQTEELKKIGAQTTQIHSGMRQANNALSQIQTEQKTQGATLNAINQETTGLRSAVNHTHQLFKEYIKTHQEILKEINGQSNRNQVEIEKIHANNISQLDHLAERGKIDSSLLKSMIEKYTQQLKEHYIGLKDAYQHKKEARDQLVIKIQDKYKELVESMNDNEQTEIKRQFLDKLLQSIQTLIEANQQEDINDNIYINNYFNDYILSKTEAIYTCCDTHKENMQAVNEKLNRYTHLQDTARIPNIKQALQEIAKYQQLYQANAGKNDSNALKALESGIAFIGQLITANKAVSNDIKAIMLSMIEKKQELLINQQIKNHARILQEAKSNTKTHLTQDNLKTKGKNYYLDAELFNIQAQQCYDQAQFNKAKQLFNQAKEHYEKALGCYQSAQKMFFSPELASLIDSTNENINLITQFQEKNMKQDNNMHVYDQEVTVKGTSTNSNTLFNQINISNAPSNKSTDQYQEFTKPQANFSF